MIIELHLVNTMSIELAINNCIYWQKMNLKLTLEF